MAFIDELDQISEVVDDPSIFDQESEVVGVDPSFDQLSDPVVDMSFLDAGSDIVQQPTGMQEIPTGFGLIQGLSSAANAFQKGIGRAITSIPRFASIIGTQAGNLAYELSTGQEAQATPADNPIYQFAEAADLYLNARYPENLAAQRSFLFGTLPSAAGSMAALAVSGGGVGAATLGSIQLSSSEYKAALDQTGDADRAFDTYLANLPIGALEGLPIFSFFKRLDRATGGTAKRVLAKGFVGGLEEFAQETTSQALTNVSAANLYDQTREILEGVGEGGAAGFALGFVLNAAGVSLRQRGVSTRDAHDLSEINEAERLVQIVADRNGYRINRLYDVPSNAVVVPDAVAAAWDNYNSYQTRLAEQLAGPQAEDVIRRRERAAIATNAAADARTRQAAEAAVQVVGSNPDPEIFWELRESLEGFGYTDLVQRLDASAGFQGAPTPPPIEERKAKKGQRAWETRLFKKLQGAIEDAELDFDQIYAQLRSGPTISESQNFLRQAQANPQPEASVTHEQRTFPIMAQEALTSVQSKFRKWLLPAGHLPSEVFEAKRQAVNRVNAQLFEVSANVKSLNEAMKTRPVSESETGSSMWLKVDQALKGDTDIRTLPVELQEPTRKLRLHVDRLSIELLNSGLIEGEMKATVMKNVGFYLHRSYRIHDDAEAWAKQIPDDIWAKAQARIRANALESGRALTEDQADLILRDMLAEKANPFRVMSTGKLGTKDLSPLLKRAADDELAPELRAFMGEYTDPLVNYVKTIHKVSNLIHTHGFLMDVRAKGLGRYFFEKGQPRPEGFDYQIAGNSTSTLAPLNGLYTSKEIADAFTISFNEANASAFTQYYMRVNGLAKFSKTVANPITHARNLIGGGGFIVANGHLPNSEHFRTAYQVMKDNFLRGGNIARVQRYYELGLLDKSTKGNELQAVVKDMNLRGDEFLETNFLHLVGRGSAGFLARTARGLTDVYQAEDNLIRLMMFEAELARYKKAYPGMDQAALEAEVAVIIRDTYPNYDLVPEAIRKLRRAPLMGPFVSFAYESVRTFVNSTKLAGHEIRSINPVIRGIGWRRATGLVAATALPFLASGFTRLIWGINDDEDEALRDFVAPWDKNGIFLHLGRTGSTREFINLAYTDPHSLLKEPLMAFVYNLDQGVDDAFASSIAAIFEPFVAEELLTKKLIEVRTNTRDGGGRVYNPVGSDGEKAAAITAHFWDIFEPGFVTQGRRFYMAGTGQPTAGGTQYELGNEAMALFGLRSIPLDVERSLSFRAKDYNEALRNARQIQNYAEKSPATGLIEVEAARESSQSAYEREFEEMNRIVESAYKLGLSLPEIRKVLRDNGIAQRYVRDLERGVPGDLFRETE